MKGALWPAFCGLVPLPGTLETLDFAAELRDVHPPHAAPRLHEGDPQRSCSMQGRASRLQAKATQLCHPRRY